MKFVIQRVTQASVMINHKEKRSIEQGLVVLMGIHQEDTLKQVSKWVDKILKLRIFADENKPINASIQEVHGEILLISQFTLYGDTKGQNRPSFIKAAKPEIAIPIYEAFIQEMKSKWDKIKTGEFGADMQVSLINDGPVTIILED